MLIGHDKLTTHNDFAQQGVKKIYKFGGKYYTAAVMI